MKYYYDIEFVKTGSLDLISIGIVADSQINGAKAAATWTQKRTGTS